MALADIIARIESDAAEEAERLRAEAHAEAEATLAEAREAAAREREDTLARARREAEADARSVLAAARLRARDARLALQRELVARALGEAEASLLALPDAEYTAFVARALLGAVRGGETVRVAAADRDRLNGLADALAATARAEGRPDPMLVFVPEPAPGLAHGALATGDRTEAEASPHAALATRRDEYEMLAAREIFGEEADER